MGTGLEEKMPISIDNVRREARALRRAGVRRAVAEFSTAKTIGEVSLLGAVAEIMGVNFFLSALGLTLVPSNNCAADEATATFGMVVKSEWDEDEEMTVQDRLSPEKLDAYESDKDPDYSPSEASDDSLEYDSDADCAEVENADVAEVEDAAVAEVEDAAEPVESAVVYEDEHATVIAEAVEEQEPVVVDTEGCDVVDEEIAEAVDTASLVVEESTGALPGTPLIDTQGFAAVAAAVAALEAAVVSEKPVEATEDAADMEDVKVEEIKVLTEGAEEIEIVDIEDAEVEVMDNPIEIESEEDAENEED